MIRDSVFKDYDIRGIYPDELNEEFAYKLAKAFCLFLEERKFSGPILIGIDARLSSSSLGEFFIKGVLEQGRDVIDIGLATSPLFYFSILKEKPAGGAMITASHNPKEYNGFKLVFGNGGLLNGEFGLPEIKNLFEKKIVVRPACRQAGKNFGKILQKDFSEEYLEFVAEPFKKTAKKRRNDILVVADAGNGSSGLLLKRFFEKTGVKNIPLFFEPDGNFPNHSPNPFDEESQELIKKEIVARKANFGFIIDADGDRIIFLDEKGDVLRSDIVYALLIDKILKSGDKIVFGVNSSKIIEDIAKKKGTRVERIRVGRGFIPEIMKKEDIKIMVEYSGHYYFGEFSNFDSSLLALSYVLGLFATQEKPFSELFSPYQKYANSGEMNFKIQDWGELLEKLKEIYQDGKQYFIDGLSVEYPDWWFNIRPSKTEPVVRLIIEADNEKILGKKKQELLEVVENF